ncbi:hypothetical protein [Kitasatospora acidiphila]|uniref:hypothetical protein n=1 Tax=Kitasatospora acidiphila TaxID=2567942 RepID=UPI003C727211
MVLAVEISKRTLGGRVQALTQLIQAITGLAWPVIVALLTWRLFPTLKEIARSRGFTVKVGEAELSVQEMSDQVVRTTAEIQGRLASVGLAQSQGTAQDRILKKVLWVDDVPDNITYEAAQLRALGVTVRIAISTEDAQRLITQAIQPFDAIVSDMGRRENGNLNLDAGMEMIRELRSRADETPVFIYTSQRQVNRKYEVTAEGGNGTTTSATELFGFLRAVGDFPLQGQPSAQSDSAQP